MNDKVVKISKQPKEGWLGLFEESWVWVSSQLLYLVKEYLNDKIMYTH